MIRFQKGDRVKFDLIGIRGEGEVVVIPPDDYGVMYGVRLDESSVKDLLCHDLHGELKDRKGFYFMDYDLTLLSVANPMTEEEML